MPSRSSTALSPDRATNSVSPSGDRRERVGVGAHRRAGDRGDRLDGVHRGARAGHVEDGDGVVVVVGHEQPGAVLGQLERGRGGGRRRPSPPRGRGPGRARRRPTRCRRRCRRGRTRRPSSTRTAGGAPGRWPGRTRRGRRAPGRAPGPSPVSITATRAQASCRPGQGWVGVGGLALGAGHVEGRAVEDHAARVAGHADAVAHGQDAGQAEPGQHPFSASWIGAGWPPVRSSGTARGPASCQRKTRSALPPLAKTWPSGVTATPMKRLAAGAGATSSVFVSTTVRPCTPPLSEDTTMVPPSALVAIPSGKRSTSTCWPAGRSAQPAGVFGAPARSGLEPTSARSTLAFTAPSATATWRPLASPVSCRKRLALGPADRRLARRPPDRPRPGGRETHQQQEPDREPRCPARPPIAHEQQITGG